MHKFSLSFVSALVLSMAGFLAPFSLSAQQNYYSVKFPDDQTIISCGGTADTVLPVITYNSNCSFNVGISVKDQVFNLNVTGGCKKILRTWKLVWWCDYDPNWPAPTIIDNPGSTDIGATAIGNAWNHGYLQYTQVIKIIDNVPPMYIDCPTTPLTFCDYTNNDPAQYGNRCEGPVNLKMKVKDACSGTDLIVSYRLFLDLDGNGTMETFRSSSDANAWPIVKSVSGDTLSANIALPTGVGLPYGKHKIEWITNDHCGNEAICKYEFEVRDCKAPTVVCLNGLSINIMQTGMITLWDTDFLQYTSDNCTPTSQIKIGIRKAGTGTGFPVDNHSVTFDCNEIGKQFVEIWAVDAYGNADYCQTYVIVQDHFGTCAPAGPVTGNVSTDQLKPLPGAKILLKSNLAAVANQSVANTDGQGNFVFASAPGTCNYSIIPSLDTLPLNGVNTLDILLTDFHISGQAPLANPYRIIAADVNRDNQLNSVDLDAMSDLLLGTTTSFPGNTSWRFVPANFVFPNPAQPLAAAFPEKISTVCPAPSGLNQHFTAIKTGDVDGSVDVSTKGGDENLMVFSAAKRRFRAGDLVEVAIQTPDLTDVAAFQFTLEADPAFLTLQSVEAGTISPRMAVSLAQNRVATSWYSTSVVEGSQTLFVLKFVAMQSGTLLQALQLNSVVTEAAGFDRAFARKSVALQYDFAGQRTEEGIATTPAMAKLFAVSPNPTSGPVAASFYLPEAGAATLTLTDLNGRVVASQSANFEKGNHRVDMPVEVGGLLLLSLQTASGTAVTKVMVIR